MDSQTMTALNFANLGEARNCYALITAIHKGRYVEFDFVVGDESLMIEMILPFNAFREFTASQSASVSFITDGVKDQYSQFN